MTASGSGAELLAPFVEDPAGSGLCSDFDGTLSEIVDDPLAAVPLSGSMEALGAVARRLARTWIVSGRPVDYLARWLPRGVQLSGLYGLERLEGGERIEHPEAARWRPVIGAAADAAAEVLPSDAAVERKGLSVTLHYRTGAASASATKAVAAQIAASLGLAVHQARMSVELRAPLEVDKGTVVAEAMAGLAAVCFIGDDIGDLSAFDALDRLAAEGVHCVRVAVASVEMPAELLERADLVLDGPAAVVGLLEQLG